jgi:hypothetical protein
MVALLANTKTNERSVDLLRRSFESSGSRVVGLVLVGPSRTNRSNRYHRMRRRAAGRYREHKDA